MRQAAGIFIIIGNALSVAIPIIIYLPFLELIFDIYEIYRITWIACYSMYIIAGVMIVASKWKVGFDKIAGIMILLAGVAYVVMGTLYWIEHDISLISGNPELIKAFQLAEEICRLAFAGFILTSGILFLARIETEKTRSIGILIVVAGGILVAYNTLTFINDFLGMPSMFQIVALVFGFGILASYVLLIIAGVMLILDSPKMK